VAKSNIKNGMTETKPSFLSKCIHTFKCLFNRDCEKIAKSELNAMTKNDLEILGRDNGIELDKRKSKAKLVEQLYNEL
jgi:hypothetical protein